VKQAAEQEELEQLLRDIKRKALLVDGFSEEGSHNLAKYDPDMADDTECHIIASRRAHRLLELHDARLKSLPSGEGRPRSNGTLTFLESASSFASVIDEEIGTNVLVVIHLYMPVSSWLHTFGFTSAGRIQQRVVVGVALCTV
jgi:hypothetical protein